MTSRETRPPLGAEDVDRPETRDDVVRAEALSFSYPSGRAALRDLDIRVQEAEIVAIVGPSGCGKSTFLNVIADSLKPQSGTLTRPGHGDLTMMFQHDTLLPWKTVEKNIALGFEFLGRSKPEPGYIDELLKLGHLSHVKDAYPKELSGGMRRRVAFLAALATQPKLLLLDEPFSAIDEPTRLSIHQDVLQIVRETRTAVLLVTHDLSEAITLSDRVAIFSNAPGRVVAQHEIPFGDERDVLSLRQEPRYSEVYSDLWSILSEQIRSS